MITDFLLKNSPESLLITCGRLSCMDTVLRKIKAKPAILVDFDTFSYNTIVQQWLAKKAAHAEIVFLVADPDHNDYDPENEDRFSEYAPELHPTAVLRNSGHVLNILFKTTALVILKDTGGLVPVLGVDDDYDVLDMYVEDGVLVALAPMDVLGIN